MSRLAGFAATGFAVIFSLGLAGSAEASSLPYRVGAARVEITPPPLSDSTATPPEFAGCPPGLSGPRLWAFEEPYIDSDGSGDFNYPLSVAEPYCDANANGRWDGIYLSGAVDDRATMVHDPIDARAIAISDGDRTVVIASVVAQGVFENYTDPVRALVAARRPAISDVVVSANHNESSPDPIGIYGAPPVPEDVPVLGGAVGVNSGINEYWIRYLQQRTAEAAIEAYDARVPADLRVADFLTPPNLEVNLSHNFPTTNDDDSAAAIDPKVRVLQARDGDGDPIATVMNLAAHNQEIGHSDPLRGQISSDWPGYFHDRLEAKLGGMAMFLVADNGSEEDPSTVPPVDLAEHPECSSGCYAQARATGDAWAKAVAKAAQHADPIRPGRVSVHRQDFFVPLENNLFKAAAEAGLFGDRQTYEAGVPVGRSGSKLRTYVSVIGVGPDLQFISNPGEAFPALMIGSPWGIDEASCPARPNPPVPLWHSSATNRFQIGLADDLLGYELPAWAFSSLPGAFNYNGPPDNGGPASCTNDLDDVDSAGHQHKLETEGAGPTASNLVAAKLTALLDLDPDPTAAIRRGRFIFPDGSVSRRPYKAVGSELVGAVAIWVADPGSTVLTPGSGTVVSSSEVGRFGGLPITHRGFFIDYDGQPQLAPDISTRGMAIGPGLNPRRRLYVDVYPALTVVQPGEAKLYCSDTATPNTRPLRRASQLRHNVVAVVGRGGDRGCKGIGKSVRRRGKLDRVRVSISKLVGPNRCRALDARGHLHSSARCGHRLWLEAEGGRAWRLRIKFATRQPAGTRFRIRSRGIDRVGNLERRRGRALRLRLPERR